MPNYTYECLKCGVRVERLHSSSEVLTVICPRCSNKEAMQRRFPCPAIHTNTTFSTQYGNDDGFGPDDRARKRAYTKARAEGINPAGKVWSPQLNTWLDRSTRKDDVRRICEARGWGCEGSVNVEQPQPKVDPTPAGPYRVAEDIVQKEVERTVEVGYEGDIGVKERKELVETTRERLSGNTSPGIDSLS